MKLSGLRQNRSAVEDGKWVGNIPQGGSLRLRVRGFTSAAYTEASTLLSRAVPREDRLRDGTLKNEASDRVMAEAIHQTILLDWAGLHDDDGQEIPYSSERAHELLTSPEYRPFLGMVAWAARIVDEDRSGGIEAVSGN